MVQSITGDDVVTSYRYDASGIRSAKYSGLYGETVYADRMYQEHFGTNPPSLITKHIFVGQSRIASKLHYDDQAGATRALFMQQNTYWYHADHLGSTNWVTDYQGEGYEHFAYTPYGESWVSENLDNDLFSMTHRFTGQELDPETGLYAFPARNYDPRTSRWLSTDPALAAYLPVAPTGDEAREHNSSLPGGGGAFDPLNLAVYHYTSNNPLGYIDPTGMAEIDHENKIILADLGSVDDMDEALNYLNGYQDMGYSVVAMSDDGSIGLGFTTYGSMLDFMESVDPSSGELPGFVGPALDLLSSALTLTGQSTAGNVVGGIGFVLGGGQILFDVRDGQVDPMDVADLVGGLSGFVNPMLPVAYHGGKAVVDFYRSVPYFIGRGYAEWYNDAMRRAGMQPRYGIPSLRQYLDGDW